MLQLERRLCLLRIKDQGPVIQDWDNESSAHSWTVICEHRGNLYEVVVLKEFKYMEEEEGDWKITAVNQLDKDDSEIIDYYCDEILNDYDKPLEQIKRFIKIKTGGIAAKRISRKDVMDLIPKIYINICEDNKLEVFEFTNWNHEEAAVFCRTGEYRIKIWGQLEGRYAWTCYKITSFPFEDDKVEIFKSGIYFDRESEKN
jgi:hypothetical protein